MRVVGGLDAIEAASSPAFVVVGVFDGLHRGHAYLLEHLVAEAGRRGARPVVITFDHHPDEVLTGSAPPILCDPDERIERLEAAGVDTTVIVHFDRALRETPYDAFVGRDRRPDAPRRLPDDARRGVRLPAGRDARGARRAGRRTRVRGGRRAARSRWTGAPVRSTADPVGDRRGRPRVGRATCSAGPHAVVGEATGAGEGSVLRFPLPVALPPQARYRVGHRRRVHPVPWPRRRPTSRTRSSGSRATAREGRTRVAFIDKP